MRWFVNWGVLVIVSLATPLLAQTTLDYPVGERHAYHYDSGIRPNQAEVTNVVSEHLVQVDGAAWLRLYFGDVELEPGSFVRITSQLDNEIQELDARGLAMWSNSSAYFNGDSVFIELVAAAKTRQNRLVIEEVAREMAVNPLGGCTYPCGICGGDKRVSSNENWSGRLFPVGCTASVWNEQSCLVSAGHCMTTGLIIQFNVPNSNPNCSINNPPVADQFPIITTDSVNGGVGNDWAVMTTGTNNLGQTIFDRYGLLRPIASTGPIVNQSVAVWGFGIDNQCTLSQTQQTDGGSVNSVSGTFFSHTVDITCGSSGSAVIRTGEILGIVTHCPCPGAATRVDLAAFAAARDALCGQPTGACCFTDGTCTVETSDDCNAFGGTYQGDGSPCFNPGPLQTFVSTPGVAIPDGNPVGVSDTITVPGPGSIIGDVNVDLTINHTWVGDLCVTLTHNNKTVTLIARPGLVPDVCDGTGSCCGCDEDNYDDIILDDEGTGGAIENQCAFNLTSLPNYTPNEALSAFDGQDKAGPWTITVTDLFPADAGTLVQWSLHIAEGIPKCSQRPTTGACCVSGACSIETEADCISLGGAYEGDGTSCSPNPCQQPQAGACCLPGDFCAVVSSFTCTDLGGTYQGDGTSCSPDPCVPPIGACCLTDGTCLVLSPDDCNLISGIYQGDGTNCSPNPCTQPTTGACCFQGGSCSEETQADCKNAGGAYQGDGTDCATTICRECLSDADCDDGDPCNGLETCVGGICQPVIPLDCDDGNPCTDDFCIPGVGCVNDPSPAGSPCEDGDACTIGDICDGNGFCQPGIPLDCDDGNPCTIDSCDAGVCVNDPEPVGTPCDDGDPCTIDDFCDGGGGCAGGPPPDCDDGNPCTDDFCDPGVGCVNIPNDALCDDGDPCTDDFCDPGAGGCNNTPITPCCGNGVPEVGEDCANCPADVQCPPGEECVAGVCEPPPNTADISGPLGAGFPDGCVDAFDLGTLLGAWCSDASDDPDPPGDVDPPCEGCVSPNFALADITGPDDMPDGCVDAFDLAKLLARWCSVVGGNPCGTCF
ncbi:MAG: proprotein convertase P-domain-containing protein [Planctomycetes bacterium]|nr:proprotein convertase P-domain-containing protein [Planctomycetota bacterium]